jgi:hypothetical protein
MHLNVKGFALASGALWGLAIFVITLLAAGRGIGEGHLSHLSAVFIGYQVTYLGSVIGLVYGFVSGLIAGLLFSVIYNAYPSAKT